MAALTVGVAHEGATAFDRLLLTALFCIAAATFPQAALIVDSGRDLASALGIARGESFPLYGPSLYGIWQLGPAWYYLLSLPLLATGSVGASTTAIGLLAACKIPLAYRLGAVVGGPALGLGFASMISLPGWSTMGQLVLSHTSLTELSVLGVMGLALRAVQHRSGAAAAASALLLGLAIHAHPTALVAAPAVGFALVRSATARGRRKWLILAAFAFLAPLAPALVAEWLAGWPQWQGSKGYFGAADYGARLARLPQVLFGLSIGQWQFVHQFLFGRWPGPAMLLGAIWGLTIVLALSGLAWRGWRHPVTLTACALLLTAWSFVVLLRDQTPVWMIYAWAPFSTVVLALGWHELWPERTRPRAARVLACVGVVLSGALLVDRISVSRQGLQFFPSEALADIAAPVRRDLPVRFWLPAWAHDTILREICRDRVRATLHGELAAALGFAQGVGFALHCPESFELFLAGTLEPSWAGIPTRLARQLQLPGREIAGGYTLVEPVRVLAPNEGERVIWHHRYRVDDYRARAARGLTTSLIVTDSCAADELVVVSNLMPGLNSPFAVASSPADPAPALRAQTLISRYYSCPVDGLVSLRLDVLDPTMTEVFVLRHR